MGSHHSHESSSCSKRSLDFWGTFVSLGCAVHCALVPFLAVYWSLFREDSWFETSLLILAVSLVCYSVFHAAFRHRRWRVFIPFSIGMTALLLAQFWLVGLKETAMVVAGLSFALTHWMNHRSLYHLPFWPEEKVVGNT